MSAERFTGKIVEEEYDVVVVGGGLAGVCAAIASARNGAKTVIIQDRPVFGGNSSSEIRVPPGGATNGGAWARETGVIEEIQLENLVRNHARTDSGMMNSIWDLVLYEKVRDQENLSFHLNTSARGVEMEGNRIKAVICEQLGSERRLRIKGKIFIDCTGDGTVGAAAGASFRMGREARDEFNESLAPEKADNVTQGSSLMFLARDVGRPVKFTPPPWAERYPTEESLYKRFHHIRKKEFGGFWWIEVGWPFNTIDQNEEIRDEALRHLLGVWDHIKNHGDHGAENMALEWIGFLPGKRESRRLMGDYILTENDVRNNTPFPDRVAYGGWFIDIHTPGGILAKDQPPEPLCGDPDKSDELRVELYSIPFRCLYSRDVENLMMAGRNISVTHVALGTTRLMLTCAVMGQAAGTAAAMCVRYGITPRELYRTRIKELQQRLLRDDCFILDMPNEDPDDKARKAKATATSSAPLSLEPNGGAVELNVHRGQIFPVSADRIDSISLHLTSSREDGAILRVELLRAEDIWHFNREAEPLKAVEVEVPPKSSGWVEIPFKLEGLRPGLYRINVRACQGVRWSTAEPMPGVASIYRRPNWRRWVSTHLNLAMRIEPPSHPFGPENAINGVSRPERWPNIWISDPSQPLPQSLTLEFGEEIEFDEIHLTFDTFLMCDFREFTPLQPPKECVRDYAVMIRRNGSWEVILEVESNYLRKRVHRFEDKLRADAIRVEVRATNGDRSARIYEVRVY